MEKYINLTTHDLVEVTSGMVIKPSGTIARVKQSTTKVATHATIPIYSSIFGDVEGLPDPVEGTIYIVSSLTMNAIDSTRIDVVSPGNLQRDTAGKPIGCVGFRTR
jgi:hypothetical protein